MPDAFGNVAVPAAVPAAGDLDGDPAISEILKFMQAFMNANALTAWQSVAPNQQVVKSIASWKPPTSFNDRDLPCLFGYRDGSPATEEWIGDDYLIETSTLTLLYILPWAQQEIQKIRLGCLNIVSKQMIVGLERGRTPGYIVTGDTDPKAATQGSLLYPFLNAWTINIVKTNTRDFADQLSPGNSRVYEALEVSVRLQERMTYGLDRYAALNGVDATITNIGGTIIDHVQK